MSIRESAVTLISKAEHRLYQLRKHLGGPAPAPDTAVLVYPGLLRQSILASQTLDALEVAMRQLPPADLPLTHLFTPGLYTREIRCPAHTWIITKVHKTEHPYIVSKGELLVWVDGVGLKRISAPHQGVTLPGTRRLCYCLSDVVWTTFHPTDETDVEKIEEDVIYRHDPVRGAALEVEAAESMLSQLLLEAPE